MSCSALKYLAFLWEPCGQIALSVPRAALLEHGDSNNGSALHSRLNVSAFFFVFGWNPRPPNIQETDG